VLLIFVVVVVIFPVYYSFTISSLEFKRIFSLPPRVLPDRHVLENYAFAWKNLDIGRLLFNSIFFALLTTSGKICLSVLTAFSIVYFNFKGKNFVFAITLLTLMMPVPVRIISTYQVVSTLQWLNSFQGLIVPLIASATGTFLLRQTFRNIPRELAEATIVDGGGPIRFLLRVLVPLAKTNIAALFVILFIWSWNQYLWPLLITTSREMRVIQLGIESVIPKGGTALPKWNQIMPVVIFAMVPPLIVILALQRSFVKGLLEPEK
jgi:sn-glycerol 3-phosphate transport system permease protein